MPNKFTLPRLRVCWLLLAILTLCSARSYAKDGDRFTYDGIRYEVISETENTCSTIRNDEVSGDIVLPSSVPYGNKSYILKEIGYHTFYKCNSLTSVTIPNSVTSIENNAFYYCSSLTSVTIPNSVTSIENNAFYYCSSLTSVTIPNSVTSIESRAFEGCSSLTSVTIPNSVTSIGDHAFYCCRSLTSVTIPNSVTSIGDSAFYGCESLTSVTIPNSVTSIGDSAFYGCESLTSVTIPNSVTSIGDLAFSYCISLTSVTIPNSVTSIGDYAFYKCSSLTSVTIPNSVTSIGSAAFYSCESLTSVTIPNSVKTIGESAFSFCSSLTSVTIPNSVTAIGNSAFYKCDALNSILVEDGNQYYSSDGVALYNADKTNLIRVPGATTAFTIPNSVTSIGSGAFSFCSSLTSVTIPNSVTSIGDYAFSNCDSLNSILVEDGNQYYSSDGVALYNADKTNLIRVPEATTAFTIPNSVTSIENRAFSWCKSLTSLVIPESVESIDSYAFYGCTLNPLRFKGTISLSEESLILLNGSIECKSEQVDYIRQFTTLPVVAWDKKYYLTKVKPLIEGFNVHIMHNADFGSTEGDTDLKIIVLDADDNELKSVPAAAGQDILITGLKQETLYKLVLSWKDSSGELCSNSELILDTKSAAITTKTDNIKQTSFEVTSVKTGSDESFQVSEVGIEVEGTKYVYKGKPIEIKGLSPEKEYSLYPYVIYNDGLVYEGKSISVSTKGWNFGCSKSKIGPTSAELTAAFTEDDAKADEVWWTFEKQKVNGKNLTLLSLTPETDNSPVFHIKYGDEEYSYTESFKTTAVEFTTLKPKCVSSSCAIVAAETNISDVELMVGFEWKKYDAPASLAPSEGYGAVCEGVLEGYIKNLQPTSYYNVRPFYKSAAGQYYYGEWVTFDPSDFSYFEPTVRTYPVQEVTSSSATVRGYALPGSDNIKRQGFQYWSSGKRNSVAAMAPAESEITTVEVAGQVMVATFSDLKDGTTYTYRAFVETDAGYSYGEEQTFTTVSSSDISSDINDVEYAQPEITVVGYYDIMGRRYDEPIRGINIVVYSDGSAKKMVYCNK